MPFMFNVSLLNSSVGLSGCPRPSNTFEILLREPNMYANQFEISIIVASDVARETWKQIFRLNPDTGELICDDCEDEDDAYRHWVNRVCEWLCDGRFIVSVSAPVSVVAPVASVASVVAPTIVDD